MFVVAWSESNLRACSCKKLFGLGQLSNLTGLPPPPETPAVVMYCCDLALQILCCSSASDLSGGNRKEPMAHLPSIRAPENDYH